LASEGLINKEILAIKFIAVAAATQVDNIFLWVNSMMDMTAKAPSMHTIKVCCVS
jgi:hypothetical protein